MKTAIILGTRPEIIKMSPVIRECEAKGVPYFILHTGQHYSYNMDAVFFEQLKLPKVSYNLDVGSGTHGEQTAKILSGVEKVLIKEKPDVVLVQGDTNTVLAGALAASKLHIKVGHVEAGLRSYDRSMPEETNRILTDHCSDYLFAPTEGSKKILLSEGIPKEKIHLTGNTVVDAVYQNLKLAEEKDGIFKQQGIKKGEYFLLTAHRAENTDDPKRLKNIFTGLKNIIKEYQLPIIYPAHPRTKKMIAEYKIDTTGITLIEPVDYLSFLQLESKAKLVITDSGGVQEEACILKTPCITLRENTERPETIETGGNILVGTDPAKIPAAAKKMIDKKRDWKNPFGDGKAGERIIKIIKGG
jgi:UDP-N-acetylglucosamine 2-epimerase (non-hydrolysing)